ncbi:alpha/beta fold hydrolase BchO [Rhodopseudomonas sp. NSM]|uniref:alpha/beta fold hydrolase BchO n=1 Tax=Rhodopseudomonas sp. NSM TaxID=3457630 RepID=UPI0040369EEA
MMRALNDNNPPPRTPRAALLARPRWDVEGRDWPNRDASQFVHAAGLRWHLQQMGCGPVLLLIHGTSAATHSWRTLAPLLAEHFTVVAPDLPGHGFTQTPAPARMTLDAMAQDLAALLRGLGHQPVLVAGHSAGAALLARMCLDGSIAPAGVVALNGALLPIGGAAGRFMLPLARLLASSTMVPRLMARFARNPGMVERMLVDTGSSIEPDGIDYYRRLVGSPGHVAAALRMMASWRLERTAQELPQLATRLLLIAGSNDKTIAASNSAQVQRMVPGARIELMPGLGHLAHEERPHDVRDIMVEFARDAGLLPRLLAAAE